MAKATDKFRQTLHDCSGGDRLDFGYSGYALVVFLEYLRDRQIFDVTASEDAELAAYLSKVRHSYFLTFDPSQAARLAAKLTASELDVGDVTQFVVGFRGPEEHQIMVEAAFAAVRNLPRALLLVHPGTVGLMSIG
ncbi:MAG TPA: hypothetical protein VMH81_40615 [Bryobacteraceae bacterium]|nr:hypothetical protein [Bryobacteraceae bacterium]